MRGRLFAAHQTLECLGETEGTVCSEGLSRKKDTTVLSSEQFASGSKGGNYLGLGRKKKI